MIRIILLFISVIGSVNCHAQNTSASNTADSSITSAPSKALSLYEQGMERYRKGDRKKAMELFNSALKQGDSDGDAGIGLLHETGEVTARNLKEALRSYERAILHGSKWGKYNLAILYIEGIAVPRDLGKYFKLMTEAANDGLQDAELVMSGAYLNGYGVEQNPKQSFQILERLVNNKFGAARYNYGVYLLDGIGTKKDFNKGAQVLLDAAKDGDISAQSFLAKAFIEGTIFSKNLNDAASWAAKAAEQGDVDSMQRYGFLLLTGQGVPASTKSAIEWFNKSAAEGDKISMNYLGRIYLGVMGDGVAMDCKQANYWFKKGASVDDDNDYFFNQIKDGICLYPEKWAIIRTLIEKQENEQFELNKKNIYFDVLNKLNELVALKVPMALCELGLQTLYYGEKFENENADGLDHLLKGAKQGSMTCLQGLLLQGSQNAWPEKMPHDSAELFRWKIKAAELGSTQAMRDVALAYQEGLGVQQDFSLAYGWRVLQYGTFGIQVDETGLSDLVARLTPKKRKAGEKFAAEWNRKFGAKSTQTKK